MKKTPTTVLLVLLLSPILFLILLMHLIDSPPILADGIPSPTVGKIRLATVQESAAANPSAAPSSAGDVDRTGAPQQAFSLALRATVGLGHECAEQKIINVPVNTRVVICYFITNTGSESIELHSVYDNHQGRIVTEQAFSLGPGVPALITTTRVLTETTLHVGTWEGLDATGAVLASASASAKSYVEGLVAELGVKQPEGDCWWTQDLSIPPDTALDFCYRLVNQTDLVLLQSSAIEGFAGAIDSSIPFSLAPSDSVNLEDLGYSISDLVTTTTNYSLTWQAKTTTAPADLPEEVFAEPVPLSATGSLIARTPNLKGHLTVGLERDTCAQTTELSVFAGTEIVFCYTATNIGGVTFTHQTVTDNFVPAGQSKSAPSQEAEGPVKRVVRENEAFPMAPNVVGEFTEAQIIDQSAIVTMTWSAYSAIPVSGTVAQTPSTLTFPVPYVSATATSQVSITVLPLASVNLIIYEDTNQNGERDDDEPGIPNVTVQLTNAPKLPFSAITSADGNAAFSDLPPAVYEITLDFEQTPFLYEATSGNLSSLLLRSGENDVVGLGYMQTGGRPQKVFVPVQMQ